MGTVLKLSAHSCRVTLLDAAVHAGRSTEEIGLQANWKDPGPLVLKYTRNRSSVPATMIKQLVRDLTQENHPVVEDENTALTDATDDDLDGWSSSRRPRLRAATMTTSFMSPLVVTLTLSLARNFLIQNACE